MTGHSVVGPHPVPASISPTHTRFWVLAWFCIAAAIVYDQRTSIGVAAPHIKAELALSDVQMSWVMSGFYWAYAFFQIPAAAFGQRYGSRCTLAISMGATSIFCLLAAICDTFASLLAVWTGMGLAIAGIFPCCAQSVAQWFPPTARGLPNGFLLSAMSAGAVFSAVLTGHLLASGETFETMEGRGAPCSLTAILGSGMWRLVFALYALPGLLWAVLFALWFRDRPDEHPSVNLAEVQIIRDSAPAVAALVADDRSTPWLRMLTHPKMLLICGQQFLRAAAAVFYATWFPTYLREVYGVTTAESGYLTSVPMLGIVLGGLAAGPICDLILKRTGSLRLSLQLVGVLSQLICGVLVLLAWIVNDPRAAVLLLGIGSFVFSFSSCTAYAVTIQVSQPFVAPAFSTMNMSGNIGAAMCPLVVGWLAITLGWQPILLFFAAIQWMAALCWVALDPTTSLFASGKIGGEACPGTESFSSHYKFATRSALQPENVS